jgi:peptidoglycan/xylan/chitin deacetylase (PgdA/CDA1 family)
VDHPSIRKHKWDHTVLGFVYRATFGSLLQLMQGRISLGNLLKNWIAASKLPLVQMGFAKDFWRDFDDQYLAVEKGRPSTFFVIPFSDHPGKNSDGPAPAFRGARYGAADVAGAIQKLSNAGCEIGLHGIDAWIDSDRGRVELEEIQRLSGASHVGVRMHWLYFDQKSHATLENAGADYDSTVGYNQTVGYRAGTAQAYKPFEVERLIELPLHIMDTALFYPSHLGLTPAQAKMLVDRLQNEVVQFGGCLTINWHDRSTAPERLWDATYRDLLESLTQRGACFSTASQTVSWFRKRRSAVFEEDSSDPTVLRVRVAWDEQDHLPALQVRTHNPRDLRGTECQIARKYIDQPLKTTLDLRICSVASC